MISSVWLDSNTNLMDMNLSSLQKIVKNKKAWHAVVHGVTKNQTQFNNWKTTTTTKALCGAEWMKGLRKLYHRQIQGLDHQRENTSLPCRSDAEDIPEREKSMSILQFSAGLRKQFCQELYKMAGKEVEECKSWLDFVIILPRLWSTGGYCCSFKVRPWTTVDGVQLL